MSGPQQVEAALPVLSAQSDTVVALVFALKTFAAGLLALFLAFWPSIFVSRMGARAARGGGEYRPRHHPLRLPEPPRAPRLCQSDFHCVRLAQRILVRIRLTDVPAGVLISSGMTCTVVLQEGAEPKFGDGVRRLEAAVHELVEWVSKWPVCRPPRKSLSNKELKTSTEFGTRICLRSRRRVDATDTAGEWDRGGLQRAHLADGGPGSRPPPILPWT
jgi:hypothetical protein